MPSDLSNLDLDEVSLVGKAANNKQFLIFKSMDSANMVDTPKPEEGIKKTEPKVEAPVVKADEEIQKAVKATEEKLRKEYDERIAKAEAATASERKIRITKEFVQKAHDELPLVGNPGEIGPALMEAAEKLEKASYETIEKALQTANARVQASNLLKELGSDAPSVGSPEEKLESLAKSMVQKDSKMTFADAYNAVLKTDEGKALYMEARSAARRV